MRVAILQSSYIPWKGYFDLIHSVDEFVLYDDAQFTRRGYTGHEHLDNVRLIHMNGRLQDPLLGVMLTPDPLLGVLGNPQSLGRYAYVTNNPASLTAPAV